MDWYVDPREPRSVSALRRDIGAYLERHAEDPGQVVAAELVAAELIANAVRHGDGGVWVSLDWSGDEPALAVHDMGPAFELAARLPDADAESGRGLFLVSALARELGAHAKRAGGKTVTARLPVRRRVEESFDPPVHLHHPLPAPEEATPGVGFGKESFLRAMVVQLVQAVEHVHGPDAAAAAVAQVGADVGSRMEEEYRGARGLVDRLTPDQLAECFVRLKAAIGGRFTAVSADPERVVLVNDACPFGDVVQRAPELCRMTSSVFGGIAARNSQGATVVLEERIAVGDPQCRVTVLLQQPPPGHGHAYAPAVAHPARARRAG